MPAGAFRPSSSSVDPAGLVLVQLGSEFDCAMTRGWLRALDDRELRVVTRPEYRELLDIAANPARCHGFGGGVLALLREARRLRQAGVARAVILDTTQSSRILASLAGARVVTETRLPPAQNLAAAVDAGLATAFAALGVPAPLRTAPLMLTTRTRRNATRMLDHLGLVAGGATICAPAGAPSAWLAETMTREPMPLVLLPQGHELDLMREFAGRAWFERADDAALRAALIGSARRVVSDDSTTLALARLMQVEARDMRGPDKIPSPQRGEG